MADNQTPLALQPHNTWYSRWEPGHMNRHSVPLQCFTAMPCSAPTAANEILRSQHSHNSTFFFFLIQLPIVLEQVVSSKIRKTLTGTAAIMYLNKEKAKTLRTLLQLRGLQWSRDLSTATSIPSLGSSNCNWLAARHSSRSRRFISAHGHSEGHAARSLHSGSSNVTLWHLQWARGGAANARMAGGCSQTLLALPFFPILSQILFLPLM